METKHTPGPWIIDWNVSRLDIFGADETTLVASLRRSPLSQAIDEAARSNARLIAAAPEMYEAIAAIATAMNLGYIPNEILSEGSPILEGLRAAIAKAEGKLCGITSKNADIVQTGDTAGRTGGK